MNYVLQKKYDLGLKTIRTLTTLSKLGESVERAHILAGNVYLEQGNFLGAANEFRAFKDKFPNSQYLPNVNMVLPQIEKRLAGK
jgi:outer membrane protein assembly factor BamD (BamD/ComL family)